MASEQGPKEIPTIPAGKRFDLSRCPECGSTEVFRGVQEILCGHFKCGRCFIAAEEACPQCVQVQRLEARKLRRKQRQPRRKLKIQLPPPVAGTSSDDCEEKRTRNVGTAISQVREAETSLEQCKKIENSISRLRLEDEPELSYHEEK